jgi:hypothetical protein
MSKINYPIFKFANVPFVVLLIMRTLSWPCNNTTVYLMDFLHYGRWVFGSWTFIAADFLPLRLSFSQQFEMKNANPTTSGPL